jgi:hypothetical protein
MNMTAERPFAVIEVDGVIVLDDPVVPFTHTVVHAAGNKWARPVNIPVGADRVVAGLATRFDIVWASAWSHNAHFALQQILGLPESPWPFLPVQFHKLPVIRAHANGRPWVWIDDSVHDLGRVDEPGDGLAVRVDPHQGITAVDPELLYGQLMRKVSGGAESRSLA